MDRKMKRREREGLLKEKKSALMKDAKENPNFLAGKKRILYVMSVILGFRIFHAISQLVYISANNIPFDNYIMTIIIMILSFLFFFFMIYWGGIKLATYLVILGGIQSIILANRDQVWLVFNTLDSFFNFINIVFHIAILIQITGMIYLIFDKLSNVYFQTMADIQNELNVLAKSYKSK